MDFLLPLDDSGQPPKSRVKDATSAHSIYESFRNADFAAAIDRARVQDVLDGAPPIPPGSLRALGQSYRANINWGEGLADHESALAAYNDLVNGVDRLFNCYTTFGDATQQSEWNEIISDAFHDTLIDWEDFHFNHLLNAHFFVSQGLGVVSWEGTRNWKYQVTSIGNFLIPRDAWACDSKLDIAIARRNFRASELFRYLTFARQAKDNKVEPGWNIPLLEKILSKDFVGQAQETNVEEMQTAYKNNDLYQSYAKIPNIRCLIYYVREFDGSYSQYIGLRDGGEKDFLYSAVSRFANANQAFVLFPYGVGTNGSFHSIRGLSQKNFSYIQSQNRLRNAALDGALIRSTLLVEAGSSSDREALTLAYAGPLSSLPAGVKASPIQMPNLANEIMPIIREMAILRKQNNGGYLSHVLSPEGGDRTAYEVQAQVAQSNVLSSASLDLFYEPWRKTGREVFRRLRREDWRADEDGAQEALEFRKRIVSQNVPWEAVMSVKKIVPVRAVGYGSPAARIASYNRLLQIAPQLDPVGQGNLVRDIIIQNVGPGMADRYKAKGAPRMGVAAKIAELENDSMQSGRGVNVLPDEDHFVHGLVHTQDGMMFVQAVVQSKIDPGAALKYLVLQVPHLNAHLGFLKPNDLRAPQIKQMQKQLGQMSEVMQGLAKAAAAGNFGQQQQQGPPQQQGQAAPPAEDMTMTKQKAELQMSVERHQTELGILKREADQRMALKDAEAAQSAAKNLRRPQPMLADSMAVKPTPISAAGMARQNATTTP